MFKNTTYTHLVRESDGRKFRVRKMTYEFIPELWTEIKSFLFTDRCFSCQTKTTELYCVPSAMCDIEGKFIMNLQMNCGLCCIKRTIYVDIQRFKGRNYTEYYFQWIYNNNNKIRKQIEDKQKIIKRCKSESARQKKSEKIYTKEERLYIDASQSARHLKVDVRRECHVYFMKKFFADIKNKSKKLVEDCISNECRKKSGKIMKEILLKKLITLCVDNVITMQMYNSILQNEFCFPYVHNDEIESVIDRYPMLNNLL